MNMYNVTLSCQEMVEAESSEDAKEFVLTLLSKGKLMYTDIEVKEIE